MKKQKKKNQTKKNLTKSSVQKNTSKPTFMKFNNRNKWLKKNKKFFSKEMKKRKSAHSQKKNNKIYKMQIKNKLVFLLQRGQIKMMATFSHPSTSRPVIKTPLFLSKPPRKKMISKMERSYRRRQKCLRVKQYSSKALKSTKNNVVLFSIKKRLIKVLSVMRKTL